MNNRTRAFALAGTAALAMALILGLWPVNADLGLGNVEGGSALNPTHAQDDYDVLTDGGGIGLSAVLVVDEQCEAARSGLTYAARIFAFGGIALLALAVTSRGRRAPAGQ